jgi:hypothetical protein
MHTITHSHRAIYPIRELIGSMPQPDEDVARLVKCALEAQAVKEEKEINVSFQLLRTNDGRLTGEVELFPFSHAEEKSYMEEQLDKYEEDPLEELHWGDWGDTRSYQYIECPGGEYISYLVQKVTPR